VPASIISTEAPASRTVIAAANAALPEPMIARSYLISEPFLRPGRRPGRCICLNGYEDGL